MSVPMKKMVQDVYKRQALTCMMFTALAAMGMGISDAMQETTMREVGGRSHAGLKGVTEEQMNQVTEMCIRDRL